MKLLFYPFIRWALKLPWSKFMDLVYIARAAASLWPKFLAMSPEERIIANKKRGDYVREWANREMATHSGWALNLAIEAAVGWLELTEK